MSRAFAIVFFLSAALRLMVAFACADLPPRYDETEYLLFGRTILEEGAPPVLWRAPGYQWFVAAGLATTPGSDLGVRILQSLVSLVTLFVSYRLARSLFGEKVAVLAGGFLAFYPSDLSFSHLLWSETLYGALALAGFAATIRSLRDDATAGVPWAALAGLLLGGATLTRSVGAVWAVVSLAAIPLLGKRALPRALVFLGAFLVVVMPWSIDASRRAGRFVLVDTNSGFNLWSGNNDRIPTDLGSLWCVGLPRENGAMPAGEFGQRLWKDEWRSEVRLQMQRDGVREVEGPDGDDWYREEALASIRRDPGGAARRLVPKLAAFWAPDFFLPRHLLRDWYGELPVGFAAAVSFAALIASAVPLLVGPGAFATLPRSHFKTLALLWISSSALLHALAYGHSRMHAPLVPLLVLAVGGALGSRSTGGAARLRRGAPWTALATAVWLAGWPAVVGLYLAPGPRHAAVARPLGVSAELPWGARWPRWMRAELEESLGNLEVAEGLLREGPAREEPWSAFLRGRIAFELASRSAPGSEDEKQHLDVAEREWQSAIQRDGRLAPALRGMARIASRRGRHEEAAEFERRADELANHGGAS